MKVLIFAHTPPPYHGQSYMVQLILDEFGDNRIDASPSEPSPPGIECHHVNVRLSDDLSDIGGFRPGKILRLLKACGRALVIRLERDVTTLYYIPGPAKTSAVIRDWLALAILRPFFPRCVFHWHAYGLGHWAAGEAEWPGGPGGSKQDPPLLFGRFDRVARAVTRWTLRKHDLSVVLTNYNVEDVRVFEPRRIEVIPNGIPDDCGDAFPTILGRRMERLQARGAKVASETPLFDVLYLAHATRTKGLFVAIEALEKANRQLVAANRPFRTRLIVAGAFQNETEREKFSQLAGDSSLMGGSEQLLSPKYGPIIYVGHVNGAQKTHLLAHCDTLVFPTFFQPETFGLVLIEALSFGLPIVATTWRGVPEITPPEFAELVPPGDPDRLAAGLISAADFSNFQKLRARYTTHYRSDRALARLAAAIRLLDSH